MVRDIDPRQTVLLLGAGVSVPSGGMTGQALADFLCQKLSSGEIDSQDLSEACSLLEDRYGRPALVQALANHLDTLQPDGGMLSLMSLSWARVYTTNYDQLVERACAQLDKPLRVIRTNHDFKKLDSDDFELLKIHGCITHDRAFGHADSMILSEMDYEEFATYRESLFSRLTFDLHTKDVLIVGQSLRDPHLRKLVDEVAAIAKKQGTANRIHVLVYSSDPARMRLLEERNLRVASGSLGDVTDALQTSAPPSAPTVTSAGTLRLPNQLLNRTVDVRAARAVGPNAARLFSGGSATYSDVADGLTFARMVEPELIDQLVEEKFQYLAIVGPAGVGKSTLARRILLQLGDAGHPAFEHVDEYPFAWEHWLSVARSAQDAGQRTYLFIDEAFKHLSGINRLVARMAEDEISALKLVLCAHSSSWSQRSKSGLLRRYGREEPLTQLEEVEIQNLVSLIRREPTISTLLDPEVAHQTRNQQVALVRGKATADMFVALKYLFANESLDTIVLEEFAQLDDDVQEIYKVASLLEATYAHASRQMILDVMDLNWSDIGLILDRVKGVLEQRCVSKRDGIYVWRTRHPVIAQVIARYKYHDQGELYFILRKIVDSLNSAMLLDRYIIPNLCDTEWGIGRLTDTGRQVELLELLCERSTNRVPWHRLIAIWLDQDLPTAEVTVRRAIKAVGLDSPIARYQVRLVLAKADELKRIGTNDYVALILEAEDRAREALGRWSDNKYSYLSLLEVGEALQRATGSTRVLEDARDEIASAYDFILDDQLLRWRQRAEGAIHSA